MLEVNNLFHATRIIEGYGVIETTGQECANLGFGKVLVITDPFLASSEHCKKLKKSLDDAKIENFLLTNVKPNPRAEDCDEMAEFAKKNHVDALMALGGGSAMDQAKADGKNCVRPILPEEKPAEAAQQWRRRNLKRRLARHRLLSQTPKVADTGAIPEAIPVEVTERTEVTVRGAA